MTNPTDNKPGLVERIDYILDPSASAKERLHRRSHLTNHDLRTLSAALRSHERMREALENLVALDADGEAGCRVDPIEYGEALNAARHILKETDNGNAG